MSDLRKISGCVDILIALIRKMILRNPIIVDVMGIEIYEAIDKVQNTINEVSYNQSNGGY